MAAVPDRPARVVRIISRMCISGVPQHVVILSAGLGPPEFETTLLSGTVPGSEGDMTYYAEAHGVHPCYIAAMSREVSLWDDLRALLAIYREIRRLRPDIVHTHTAKAGFLGRVAAWLARTPVIVHTYHGHVLRGYFGPAKSTLYRCLERICGWLSTSLVTVSAAVRDDLAALGVARPAKMRVIELGLELQRFARTPRPSGVLRAELGLGSGAFLAGYCGRLVPIKNLPLLLGAAAELARRHPHFHLAVIGDGEERAALEALAAELGVAARVHFLGWRTDTPPLYADLDLMVLTSLNEGTPVAVLEAAAAGLPSVATAVGGVIDVVTDGETGWLVPSQDQDALVSAVEAAMADPARCARFGRLAQERVLERFDASRLVHDVRILYDELLRVRRRERTGADEKGPVDAAV